MIPRIFTVTAALALGIATVGVAVAVVNHAIATAAPATAPSCESVAKVFTPVNEAPLKAPFQSLCVTTAFTGLVERWGASNLTIAESNDTNGSTIAEFRFTWTDVCHGEYEGQRCGFTEWWTADLNTGAVHGPFGGNGSPGIVRH
jgi:hypothetical protein